MPSKEVWRDLHNCNKEKFKSIFESFLKGIPDELWIPGYTSIRTARSKFIQIELNAVFVTVQAPVGKQSKIDSFNSDFLKPLIHKTMKWEETNSSPLVISISTSTVNSFVDILGSIILLPKILLPTRVTNQSKTLIDNIFSGPAFYDYLWKSLLLYFWPFTSILYLPELDIMSKSRTMVYSSKKNWSRFEKDNFIKLFNKLRLLIWQIWLGP